MAATDKTTRPAARLLAAPVYDPDPEAWGREVPCPDRPPSEILTDPNCVLDARLWEGRFSADSGHVRLREGNNGEPKFRYTKRLDRDDVRRLREDYGGPSDWFQLGIGQLPSFATEGPLTANYIPVIPGPATRQQYWADYFASSAKCFEAYHHQGIARRAVNAMVQFPLGRGVVARVKDKKAQAAWDAFWNGNKMDRRFRGIARDLSIFGEQFLRYFPAARSDPRGLIVRSLDPATIYEVVTDQEDIETVYFYHQQYQTQQQLYSPPQANRAPQGATPTGVTLYIIRQIDQSEIDHYKINSVESEKRGRSDLFPALGDLKRLRDLMTSKVIQADVVARVLAVLKAKGTQADINRLIASIFPNNQPPPPASIVGLNDQVDLEPFQYQANQGTRDFTHDELVNLIAVATGISKEYLGVTSDGATKANALVATEPTTKVFDERQEFVQGMLHDMFDRVMAAANINGEVDREFIFPSIAQEDRQQLLADLETSEANQWISKRTAAATAAEELGISTYDFDDEQKLIAEEFKDALDNESTDDDGGKPKQGDGVVRRPAIRATSRQTPKLDPTKAQSSFDDEPPGLLVPTGQNGQPVPPDTPEQPAQPGQKTTAGMPANQNVAGKTGAATVKQQASESVTLTHDALSQLLREAYATGRQPRRRPDDPIFEKHASEYREKTKQNLDQLMADIAGGLPSGRQGR